MKDVWQGELARWEKRDLSARRYLYFWADGIYFQPRMEHDGFVKLTRFTPKSREIVDGCFTQLQWLSLMEKCQKQITIS